MRSDSHGTLSADLAIRPIESFLIEGTVGGTSAQPGPINASAYNVTVAVRVQLTGAAPPRAQLAKATPE